MKMRFLSSRLLLNRIHFPSGDQVAEELLPSTLLVSGMGVPPFLESHSSES
ncbi:hypothetical protein [Halalkalibaculum roseum]|uniref:hypothetical protein n=1 Tax=Halalkalibaculum roseum TaxID=2709311 RepID=UPI002011FA20|nr:hypothetical protein [Halalkalibaculum roseum]